MEFTEKLPLAFFCSVSEGTEEPYLKIKSLLSSMFHPIEARFCAFLSQLYSSNMCALILSAPSTGHKTFPEQILYCTWPSLLTVKEIETWWI